MGFLTSSELTQLRADMELTMLPDTCVLWPRTVTRDSYGSPVQTFAAGDTVSCRVDPLEKAEGIFGGVAFDREDSKAWYKIWVPYNTSVNAGDKVVYNDVVFEVLRTFGEQTYATLKQLFVVKFEGDTS